MLPQDQWINGMTQMNVICMLADKCGFDEPPHSQHLCDSLHREPHKGGETPHNGTSCRTHTSHDRETLRPNIQRNDKYQMNNHARAYTQIINGYIHIGKSIKHRN